MCEVAPSLPLLTTTRRTPLAGLRVAGREEPARHRVALVRDRDALAGSRREVDDALPAGVLALPVPELELRMARVRDQVEGGGPVGGSAPEVRQRGHPMPAAGGRDGRRLDALGGRLPLRDPGVGVAVLDAVGGGKDLADVRRGVVRGAEGGLESELEVVVLERSHAPTLTRKAARRRQASTPASIRRRARGGRCSPSRRAARRTAAGSRARRPSCRSPRGGCRRTAGGPPSRR